MRHLVANFTFAVLLGLAWNQASGQDWKSDSAWKKSRKNIVRYNLSNALLFGFDQAIIFGYERVLSPKRSFSINVGQTGLPGSIIVETDSFTLGKDLKTSGFNFSADYRFYLAKENKYHAPRGVYIGPYYSFNNWKRENSWDFTGVGSTSKDAITNTSINLHSIGFELGYQFIFWDRLALDMVLIGPGMGFYNLEAKSQGNLTDEEREQLQDAIVDLISQKFPGMNYVLSDEAFNASGTIKTTTLGFRYLIHIGFRF
jgi:hypothetical protein